MSYHFSKYDFQTFFLNVEVSVAFERVVDFLLVRLTIYLFFCPIVVTQIKTFSIEIHLNIHSKTHLNAFKHS